MIVCKYCRKEKPDEFLECQQCGDNVHPLCLRQCTLPGGLLGDVFYVFICQSCSDDGIEKLERDRMKWVDVLLLTLYNLSKSCSDQSCKGYFHWDKHIKKFVNTHWKIIFPHLKTKRKSWTRMISTTLKLSEFFACGDGLIEFPYGLTGWYKLARPDMLPNYALKNKGKKRKRRLEPEQPQASCTSDDSVWFDSSSQTFHMLCAEGPAAHENMYSRSYVKPSASLSEYLFAGEDTSDDVDIEVTESESAVDIRCNEGSSSAFNLKNFDAVDAEESKSEDLPIADEDIKEEPLSDAEYKSFCEDESTSSTVIPESLFVKNPNSKSKPWIRNTYKATECNAMNENEEHYVLTGLAKRISRSDPVSIADIRLHRKLRVRRLKRERNLSAFDLDACSRPGWTDAVCNASSDARVLDRYHHQTLMTAVEEEQLRSFRTRLMGHTEQYTCFTSPFTQRVLKPFIRRDFESCPLWLKLLRELQSKVNGKDEYWTPQPRAPVDYTYVRPQHIPAVNSLAQQYFWPGINLSECLQYPDFSCVVLYKKLIIAFAFLVPDVSYNEAYISFIFTRPEWRRAGIATFMLYHIIQTCMGRDITLHVSATNPALLLYQKFGFKVEEFVQDFYEKYMPIDSNECKHALFLRLSR